MKRTASAWLPAFATLAWVAAGCSRSVVLKPAPGAPLASGERNAAVAEQAGVRIEVQGDAWSAEPLELTDTLTPVLVRLENRSGRPLLVRYSEFKLIEPRGRAYDALPPYRIDEKVVAAAPVPAPLFQSGNFSAAPEYRPYFGDDHLGFWENPLPSNHAYYGSHYQRWEVDLPTRDMLARAIPEGVIRDGGFLSGFLYFEKVPSRLERVDFTAQLVDASTQQPLAELRVPLAPAPAAR